VQRGCSYLHKITHAVLHFRTVKPDYSDLPDYEYYWEDEVYSKVHEEIATDIPEPLGRRLVLTIMWMQICSMILQMAGLLQGLYILLIKTRIDRITKKQATVETATYCLEFVALCTCDLRLSLRYLGLQIHNKSIMLGNKKSLVDSCPNIQSNFTGYTQPYQFTELKEPVSANIIGSFHIEDESNLADILTSIEAFFQIWGILQPLIFFAR